MRSPILALVFWLLSTLSLISLLAVVGLNQLHPIPLPQRILGISTGNSYVPNPIVSTSGALNSQVQTGDARPIIIAEFLETHASPLKPYDYFGQFLTDLADRYNLDFRLLPSISMQESNLCKKIPEGSFNCLGLGIHSKGTWTFTSYEQNFEAAAKILREKYLDQGLLTPDEIQDKYTPSSNGSWEFAVNHFMDVLETAEF